MKLTAQEHNVSQYVIDPAHTTVAFSVRHLMITTVRGVFDTVSGSVNFAPDALLDVSLLKVEG
jgi:polyisoprenoid-binding protein YceI